MKKQIKIPLIAIILIFIILIIAIVVLAVNVSKESTDEAEENDVVVTDQSAEVTQNEASNLTVVPTIRDTISDDTVWGRRFSISMEFTKR